MNFSNGLFDKFETIEFNGIKTKNIINFYDVMNIEEKGEFFFEYNIQGNENLDMISYKVYNDPSYYWIIIVLNKIQDPLFDLPLSERELSKYTKFFIDNSEEYTAEDYYRVYKMLEERNNEKRKIKLVRPEKLSTFLTMFKEA